MIYYKYGAVDNPVVELGDVLKTKRTSCFAKSHYRDNFLCPGRESNSHDVAINRF